MPGRSLIAAAALWLAASVAISQPILALTPFDLVNKVQEGQGRVSFQALRIQHLVRQNDTYHAALRVHYRDDRNYRVIIEDPGKLTNVNLWLEENRATVFFPDENLLFRNDNASGATEVTATILGQITTNPDLMYRNYDLRVMPDADVQARSLPVAIAGRDCHVLDVVPRRGYSVPGHRFWIAKDDYQIMREDRTWGDRHEPYFRSYYEEFAATGQLDLEQRIPRDVNAVELKAGSRENSFVFYKAVAEAEKAVGAKLAVPSKIPSGFVLNGVEVSVFYGSRMVLVSYTDGMNWLYVRYRPSPNLWVTLLAGAYATRLVDKFIELTIQSPYNYYARETGEHILFAYGDLYPDELKNIGDSLQLQTASR